VGQRTRTPWSRKGLLAAALLLGTVVTVAALYVHRLASGTFRPAQNTTPGTGEIPAAASRTPRTLDLGVEPSPRTAAPQEAGAAEARIPALVPTPDELVEPIGVRPAGRAPGPDGAGEPMRPEDAPVLLVSTRPERRTTPSTATEASGQDDADEGSDASLRATQRNLEAYQKHLQGLLQTLDRTAQRATGVAGATPDGASPAGMPTPGGPLLSAVGGPPLAGLADAASALGTLAAGTPLRPATRGIAATRFAQRGLTLPQGTAFTCALKTRVVSAAAGAVACQVQRNVYGDDGRVLLIERGSHLDGDYRVASLRPGSVRIPVIWTRLRTPHGVVVDLDRRAPGRSAKPACRPCRQPLGRAHRRGHAAVADRRRGQARHPAAGRRRRRRHHRAARHRGQHQQAGREGAGQHDQHPAADLPEPGRSGRHRRRARRRLLRRLRTGAGAAMNGLA
jgi:type IV secretion system protein VirB10